jgi:glycerol-3-phosphate dehydrogenase
MTRLRRLNEKLQRLYGGRVQAKEDRGRLILNGSLDQWEDVVNAGHICVKKGGHLGVVNDITFTGAEISPMRVPPFSDQALDGLRPDVLIIGGGVIGCAAARELTRYRLSVLLCEYVGRILHPAAAVFYSCGGEI